MAVTVAQLQATIGLDASPLSRGLSMATGDLNRFAGLSGNIGAQIATGLGAAIVGVGAAAVKMSVDFNASMARVATLIPNNIARVNELKAGVQDLAIQTGKSTKEISEGLFLATSAWGDNTDAVKNLETATRAAVASSTEVSETVKLLSGVTKAYGDASAGAVQHVSDLAFKVDSLGITTIQELIPAMTKVAPLTSQLGVSMEQMSAVFATASGVTGNAARVSTQLQGALQSLLNPTKTMSALYKKLGVDSGQALIQQRGLQGALELIVNTAKASDIPLAKFIGRVEGQRLAYYLAGKGAQDLSSNMSKMQNVAGSAERAFKQQSEGINKLGFQWNQLKQSVTVLGQTLGDELGKHLQPVVQWALDLVKALRDGTGPLAEWKAKLEGIGEATRGFIANIARAADRVASPIAQGALEKRASDFARSSGATDPYMLELQRLAGRGRGGAFPQGAARPSAGSVPGTSAEEMARRTKAMSGAVGELIPKTHKLTDAERELQRVQEQRADAQYKLSLLAKGMSEDEAQLLTQLRKAPPALAQQVLQLNRRTKAILDGREAAEQAKKARQDEHERFVQAGKDLKAEIEDLKTYSGLAKLKNQFPHEPMRALEARQVMEAARDRLKLNAESARQAEEEENRVNQSMRDTLKQAQLDAMATQAKRKYGEVNRESLALESEWNKHYIELAPNQQKIIDQLYEIGLAKEMNERLDERAKENAEALVRAAQFRQERELQARQAAFDKQKQIEREKQEMAEKQLEAAMSYITEQQHAEMEALADYAHGFAGIFTQAFRDVEEGSKGFFKSIVQGFEKMLQEMALKYLESQLANLFFNLLGNAFGGNPLQVQPTGGGIAGRASGGLVAPGQRYLVGENGPEILTMGARRGGTVTPTRMAGAGGHTFNIQIVTPDVSGFQRSRGQLETELGRAVRNSEKRYGG